MGGEECGEYFIDKVVLLRCNWWGVFICSIIESVIILIWIVIIISNGVRVGFLFAQSVQIAIVVVAVNNHILTTVVVHLFLFVDKLLN